ncbi:Rpn family recombination-promoting nuclease/putative transposase [Hyalangium gracile]|uniref:Rpn family recombination-promoting nuclease/putative transposase n=1 Tax=Hyalangium gracile TaxID=394092 RepID=UPI001CCB091E|nr:Rpn family recombination-promoting nuclease/putative transposase [Hyalangium gracile]
MSGPHDRLVRFTFNQRERAEAELRAALPDHVVVQVDWASLQLESGSVVDPELRETESDMLFSARLRGGRTVLFYVLLEHQSTVSRWMALRMLRYVVRQLEHWHREHPGSELLPVIIPLVMYHGPGGAWSAPRRVEELFDVPGEHPEQWRALVPRFEYLLDDLTTEREEALRARPGPPLVRLVLLALVYGRREELAQRLPGWRVLFIQALGDAQGMEDLKAVFHYLLLVGDEDARDATVDMLKSVVSAQHTEELMSTWFKEKFEKLEQKGRAAGRAEDVLRVLTVRGVPVDDVARQRILACTDLPTLDRWLERAVKASSVSEVLA